MADEIAETERRILRLVVQNPAARIALAAALGRRTWRDMAHRIVFEILASLPQLSSEPLRQILPARLANAGIPDFPWQDLFEPEALSLPEAEAWLRPPDSQLKPI
jgi:hypothetical protein